MGEGKEQIIQAAILLAPYQNKHAKDADHQWVIREGGDDENDLTTFSTSSIENSRANSNGSTSSLDLVDDASSPTSSASSSSCSSSNSSGPLFELSTLMANLPIKRGLSKYYEGKSQSFTSLSSISSIEDLAEKEIPCRKKLKASNSYGNGLDGHKASTLPKALVSKKISRASVSSLSFPSRKGSIFKSTRPPLAPVQKKF